MRENYHVTMEIEGSEIKSITAKQQKKRKYLAVGFAYFEDLICSTSLFLYKGIQGCL